MSESTDEVLPKFLDIVQSSLAMRPLDYHAFVSALRTHDSAGEDFLSSKRKQKEKSTFATFTSPSDPSSITYQPSGGTFVSVTPGDRSSTPYAVSIPARGFITSRLGGSLDDTFDWTCFHDTPTKTEHTFRHPFTTMDSDVEEDEDIRVKYPEYQATKEDSPITTTATEHLYCIAFVGPQGKIVSELKASYPLQLSVRIDESRKFVMFDCFEFKPLCADLDDPDLTKYYPTGRGYERWGQAFRPQDIDVYDDDYRDDDMEDPYYTEKMQMREGADRDIEKTMIFFGFAGNFAYSRCLRFRFPFKNIVGISLQTSIASNEKSSGTKSESEDVGAVLVFEVSRPPPDDAFATRKVESRWSRENEYVLIKDWTPKTAASKATRIYLYGNLKELKQTAALMAKKWPPIAAMLVSASSKQNKNNSLLGSETSIKYSASPSFSVSENVTYGSRNHSRTRKDLDPEDAEALRNCYRTRFCEDCGTVWFRGNTGFPCTGCGDGRMTQNLDPTTESAFNGQIDNALDVFEAKCNRLDEERRGTQLKRKILGDNVSSKSKKA